MSQRPAFRHIAPPLDVDDGALAKLADQLGVPMMVKPQVRTPAAAPEPAQDSSNPEPGPSPRQTRKDAPVVKKPAVASRQAENELDKLTFEFPRYLIKAIKRDAIERRTTARHVLMLALQGAGFEIDPADLIPDARRKTAKP
jgi:hypothetical protein